MWCLFCCNEWVFHQCFVLVITSACCLTFQHLFQNAPHLSQLDDGCCRWHFVGLENGTSGEKPHCEFQTLKHNLKLFFISLFLFCGVSVSKRLIDLHRLDSQCVAVLGALGRVFHLDR